MISIKRSLMIVSLLLCSVISHAETFVFTAIPDEDETRLDERFGRVADYLSKELGVRVQYIPVKSYPAAISAFRNDQVQLAWFGGLSGVQARRLVPGSQAIAQGYEDQFFKTYFIANTTSGLMPSLGFPSGIAGKTFTFGSKGSTSGRLMPEYYIRQFFEKSPEEVFERVGYSGDHSRTIAQVQAGAYDVGAVNYTVWDNELAEGKIDLNRLRIIWTTPTYPDYQWTIRGDVDARFGEGFTEKVQQALLAMKDESLLASFPRQRFVPASNEDYAPIQATGEAIGILDEN